MGLAHTQVASSSSRPQLASGGSGESPWSRCGCCGLGGFSRTFHPGFAALSARKGTTNRAAGLALIVPTHRYHGIGFINVGINSTQKSKDFEVKLP